MEQFDFRRMSIYQIWIRSFYDGNGDGIGDLPGVYEKLDYIRSLGVDAIWFSPIYPSPNADFGYDVADYKGIHPDYGTMEDFQRVLSRAHALGMKVILDLVINHTSDQHPWFLESRKGRDNPYSDYYIWRDPIIRRRGHKLPNNWSSQFAGPAWEYGAERDQYYLHLFSKNQPDLNMDNPRVREEIREIMRFWLDMGVDGFREDVITYISKHEALPNGVPFLPVVNGMPYYKDGPNIMRYLGEFLTVDVEKHFRSGIQPVADVIAVQHDAVDAHLVEFVVQNVRDGAFPTGARAGEPKDPAFVPVELLPIRTGNGIFMPHDFDFFFNSHF